VTDARELGRTGIRVYPVGLGAMPLSIQGRPDEARAMETLRAALDVGVNFIDTANVYCEGEGDVGRNERLIRTALEAAGRVKSVTVATKGGLARPNGAWTNDARPASLRRSCEDSLRALKVEAIVLYQLHAPDPKVPFEDSVGELARLKEEGKILHVGLSNVDAAQLERAQKIARIESVQNRCNPFDASDYGGIVRACESQGVSYLPYSTVGGFRSQQRVGDHPVLLEIGRKHGASPYAVTVAWHLRKSPSVIPIPGASRPESIRDSAAAARLELGDADMLAIDSLGK
jgi:aryl-alcohol dehydrogenase-like predicted oxidoreductase